MTKKRRRVGDDEERKFRINECLLMRPVDEHRKAMKIIPRLMGISLNTFHHYRNILVDSSEDIPHRYVVMMEKIFCLQPGELLIKSIQMKPLDEVIHLDAESIPIKKKMKKGGSSRGKAKKV